MPKLPTFAHPCQEEAYLTLEGYREHKMLPDNDINEAQRKIMRIDFDDADEEEPYSLESLSNIVNDLQSKIYNHLNTPAQ